MSSKRPAAFRRGAIEKPISLLDNKEASLPEIFIKVFRPVDALSERILANPKDTNVLLSRSSFTTSATVPKATRSINIIKFGSSKPTRSNHFILRNAWRSPKSI